MAEVKTRETKPDYRCLLCLAVCNVPRQLPCFHVFCTDCLNTYIHKEHVIADNRRYVPCPVCENPCCPPNPEAPVSSWASRLPEAPVSSWASRLPEAPVSSWAVSSPRGSSQFLGVSSPRGSSQFLGVSSPRSPVCTSQNDTGTGEPFCHCCLTDDEKNLAQFWCCNCMEALCKQCIVLHRKNRFLSQHKVVEIGVIKGTRGLDLHLDIKETCSQHNGKILELYCLDHNSLCCVLCATLSHRACKHVRSLDDVAKNITQGHLKDELDKMTDKTKSIVAEDENKLNSLDSNFQTMTSNMTTVIQKAKNKLDDLHARFKGNLEQTYKRDKNSLSKLLRTNQEFEANLRNTCQLLTLINEQGSDRQKLIVEEQSKTQLTRHFRRFQQQTRGRHNTFDIKINYNETLENINSMTSVGCLEVSSSVSSSSQDTLTSIGTMIDTLQTIPSLSSSSSSSSSDLVGTVKRTTVQPSPGTQRINAWTGCLSLVKSVQGNTLGGEMKDKFTGGVFVEGEGLLIADCYNDRLLLFDDNYNDVTHYDLDDAPSDMAHGYTAGEVLVSFYTTKTILRYTLHDGVLNMVDKISTSTAICSLAVFGDNIIVGSFGLIQVITINGQQVKCMKTHGGDTCIAVSRRGDVYYRDNDVIVCQSFGKEEMFRHSYQGMREVRGIDVDQDGNVYIGCSDSGNVHLVSADGSKSRVLLPKLSGITKPLAVIVNPTKQEIVVTSDAEEAAFEVYKFCDQ
ncbi:probable E3 ubiquitin-protein ligase MID2 [Mizuhopecten yessoensis]|uniref:probable E3 ubiquitin-protein ligase MID2 n=1 Tax=Mizuhopecten yessoensis TaxID=6573 RepID=UPI000B45A6F5|nr:probable E3 ubiquitin-protein ligase MID2 [Mizuhopecten yessoensis]